MDAYSQIEKLVRDKYGKNAATRKAIGDFMLTDSHAINVKSNNVAKRNYSLAEYDLDPENAPMGL